jgi:predicted TIM-barrel fold metal-dependent hydrolase
MQRVVKKGVRGLAIPCTAPPDQPYSDPIYEPFWSAVEETGIPLTMHIFCGAEWGMSLPKYWNQVSSYALALAGVAWTVETLITSGVVARHPGLQFVCAEWETGWMAHWLQRLDHAAYRAPRDCSPDMVDTPSAYFRRNFHVTFEDDEFGLRTRDGIGVDRMLWGNDYPHHDSIWPNSRQTLERIMRDVPEREAKAMTWDNVVRLYELDEAKIRKEAGLA